MVLGLVVDGAEFGEGHGEKHVREDQQTGAGLFRVEFEGETSDEVDVQLVVVGSKGVEIYS